MSCKHGNWEPCDECKAEDDAFKNAFESGKAEAQEEIKNWTEGYALLLKENGMLKHLLDRISETTVPYDESGKIIFTDEVIELWNKVYPYKQIIP